jgi:hypothetical protein
LEESQWVGLLLLGRRKRRRMRVAADAAAAHVQKGQARKVGVEAGED